jgi:hypothetical protein
MQLRPAEIGLPKTCLEKVRTRQIKAPIRVSPMPLTDTVFATSHQVNMPWVRHREFIRNDMPPRDNRDVTGLAQQAFTGAQGP